MPFLTRTRLMSRTVSRSRSLRIYSFKHCYTFTYISTQYRKKKPTTYYIKTNDGDLMIAVMTKAAACVRKWHLSIYDDDRGKFQEHAMFRSTKTWWEFLVCRPFLLHILASREQRARIVFNLKLNENSFPRESGAHFPDLFPTVLKACGWMKLYLCGYYVGSTLWGGR